MAITMKQILKRHGAFVAAVAAACVGGVILVQHVLQAIMTWIIYIAQTSDNQPYWFPGVIIEALLTAVPCALGFFLCLWLVAPIAEELRLPHVVTRSVLATGIGATVVFVVRAIMALFQSFSGIESWFGNSMIWPSFNGGSALSGLAAALSGSIAFFIAVLPLGILAGVLLWMWRKDHPPRRPLSGLIDEV